MNGYVSSRRWDLVTSCHLQSRNRSPYISKFQEAFVFGQVGCIRQSVATRPMLFGSTNGLVASWRTAAYSYFPNAYKVREDVDGIGRHTAAPSKSFSIVNRGPQLTENDDDSDDE